MGYGVMVSTRDFGSLGFSSNLDIPTTKMFLMFGFLLNSEYNIIVRNDVRTRSSVG